MRFRISSRLSFSVLVPLVLAACSDPGLDDDASDGSGGACAFGECSPGSGGSWSGSGGAAPGSGGNLTGSGGATSSGGSASGGDTSSGGGGDVELTGVETPTPPCTVPTPPSYESLATNAKLPDPFTKQDGSAVTTREDWACRRAEIASFVAEYELGPKPPKPSSVTASSSGSNLNITVSEGGKSIDFSVVINKPSGAGPHPAIITYGFASLPIPSNVASIRFSNDDIAEQTNGGSRGRGKFYQLYGENHGAGAMMAWAWGVSRILDALESTPTVGIDATRVGVTGCSRNGKGALVAGAYDARIALTLPQESGSGGAACWRVSDYQKSNGTNVQTLSQIVTENVWFRSTFSQFGSTANKLPFDHHMLAGLVAPRGLLMIENTSQTWLGNVSCFQCGVAARRIWDALGVSDHMGFSQSGHADHCGFPSAQQPELTAYINKFLLGGSDDTDVLKTDGGFTFDETRWVDWQTPELL